MHELNLENGSRVNLVPPVYGSEYWHLDLRPTAARTVEWHNGSAPRVKNVDLPPWLVPNAIRLMLVREKQTHPDYYPLLPTHALAA
jgi:hypothetical protein